MNGKLVVSPTITNGNTEKPVTTRQIAEHLQVTTRTLGSYRAARKIPFWKINARNFRTEFQTWRPHFRNERGTNEIAACKTKRALTRNQNRVIFARTGKQNAFYGFG